MKPKDFLRNGYDVFISHNHSDKVFARNLAERISKINFNGRKLRPWLDEKFLDPGDLGQEAELTTALDRSRLLLIILSPASVSSKWVDFELKYFLQERQMEEVVPLLKIPCRFPAIFDIDSMLNFTDSDNFENSFDELVNYLCPRGESDVAEAEKLIEHAWGEVLAVDPGGFDANPLHARDALLDAILHFPIDNPVTEGLALTGFLHAAELLLRDHRNNHSAAYNMKMCLGECLAVAIFRNSRYRQVAQRYVDMETVDTEDPVLSFVVMRAWSKLAEIDPSLIDFGILLRIATQLDKRANFNNKMATVAMLIGRIAGKLRNTDSGDLLIQSLSEGGIASRIAAIGGISMAEEHSQSVFYLNELEKVHSGRLTFAGHANEPPSRKLQALLFGIDLYQPELITRSLDTAKYDLRRYFAIDDLPYGYTWFALKNTPPAVSRHRTPFMGIVVKATVETMEEVALQLNAMHVVCLTEPRIVEALFEQAGSLIIPVQDINSPQCQRLIGRDISFAMLDPEQMANLKNGDLVVIEDTQTRIVVKK